MDTAWSTSDPAMLSLSVDTQNFRGEGIASNLLAAALYSLNSYIEFVFTTPLDLSTFDEIRFWIHSNQRADGSATSPFFLQFSYIDAGDDPSEQHQWLIPVSDISRWEHRRIGIENDRRNAITSIRFTSLTNNAFNCRIDELLAVREEMFLDLEQAIVSLLDRKFVLPDLTSLVLAQAASAGDQQIVVTLNRGLSAGNRILLHDGNTLDEIHEVTAAIHDTTSNTTTLILSASDSVKGNFPVSGSTLSLIIPAFFESPPVTTQTTITSVGGTFQMPSPAIAVTMLDAREDLNRTTYFSQRDSFRQRGALIYCSTRQAPRAYLVDYEIVVFAPFRVQQLQIQTYLAKTLSIDSGLLINGEVAPVWILPPPYSLERRFAMVAPIYLRIGTRMEIAPRRETPWVKYADILTGSSDAHKDQEGIVIIL